MKRTAYIGLAMTALAPFVTQAQDQADALRYSQLILGGTARFMAMGGAFTALGGDASTLAYNPAGLGVFNKSQITFSPGFSMFSNSATFNGTTENSIAPSLNIQNAAWIASWKNRRDEAMWKTINVGIAYTRTNDFTENVNVQGNNSATSMLDQFVENANGNYPSSLVNSGLDAGQAYNAGLLTRVSNDSSQYTNIVRPFLNGTNSVLQQKTMNRYGSMGETDFSFGANYNNRLYLGITLGLADINYTENASYTETPNYNDTVYGLQNFTYQTTLHTFGEGINLKIGAIYRITDWLRIGAAVHTPTWFTLTDNYSSYISANYQNTNSYPNQAGTWSGTSDGNPMTGSYNYSLVTPFRAMGGLAFVIHKQAIISADYEYVDYSTALLSSADAGTYSVANAAIQQYYMPASNLRVGAELKLFPFSVRLGYQYYGNPYSSSSGNSSMRQAFSGGFGVKINRCFIDLAYVLTEYNENYYLYDPSLVNAATFKNSISDVVVTFGVNF
jgi:hypothetical protein